jgi:hypothetical protein
MDGGAAAWPVLWGRTPVTAARVRVAADEDQGDRRHTTEQVAFVVCDQPS